MKKNLITYIIIALLILAGLYWGYTKFVGGESEPTGGITVAGEEGAPAAPVDETTAQANQFIQILKNVDQVTLAERSLLTNKLFQTGLQDFGRPISDRPVGRNNPFAPVTGLESIPTRGRAPAATSSLKTTETATSSADQVAE